MKLIRPTFQQQFSPRRCESSLLLLLTILPISSNLAYIFTILINTFVAPFSSFVCIKCHRVSVPCQRNLITHEHVYQKYRQSAFHLRTIQVSVLHFTLHSPLRFPSSISAQSSIEIIHRNIRREKACYFTCKYLLPTSAAARKTASAAEVLRFPHFFMVPSSFFQLPEFHCICICCGWVAANSMCSLVIFFFILTVKSRGGSVSETYFCLFAWQRLTHSIHCLLDSIFSAVLVSFQASMTA